MKDKKELEKKVVENSTNIKWLKWLAGLSITGLIARLLEVFK
jgi:hypothetical protein